MVFCSSTCRFLYSLVVVVVVVVVGVVVVVVVVDVVVGRLIYQPPGVVSVIYLYFLYFDIFKLREQ